MRLAKRLWAGLSAAGTLAWLYAVGGGGVVAVVAGAVVRLGVVPRVVLAVSLGVIAAALILTFLPRYLPQKPSTGRGDRWVLYNHNLLVLGQQRDRLHNLFVEARDSGGEFMKLSAVETMYQHGVEPIIKLEILAYGDLYRRFFDDTGFAAQATYADAKQTKMANFLERRHARLGEVIEILRQMQASESV